jgi:flavodoxin
MKSLIVCYSHHHNNTQKIAEVMAKVLDAQINTPQQTNPEELQGYDLVGFGSGIYGGKAHRDLLKVADDLSQVTNKKAFIFSTSGGGTVEYMAKTHKLLKEKLESKGYTVVDEFTCKGLNTFAFLKPFGGMNKGRPNEEDLKHAEEFATKMRK